MSLLTQFYPGTSGGGGGGVGSFYGVYASDPANTNAAPTLFLTNAISGSPSADAPEPYRTVTFTGYRPTLSNFAITGPVTKIVDMGVFITGNNSISVSGSTLTAIDGLTLSINPPGTLGSNVTINNKPGFTSITRIYRLITLQSNASTIEWNFSNNALNQASVDAVLVALDAGKGVSAVCTKTINISGGTNAAPGAAGVAARASLVAQGWTVTTN